MACAVVALLSLACLSCSLLVIAALCEPACCIDPICVPEASLCQRSRLSATPNPPLQRCHVTRPGTPDRCAHAPARGRMGGAVRAS